MKNNRKLIYISVIIVLFLLFGLEFLFFNLYLPQMYSTPQINVRKVISPTPFVPFPYRIPVVEKKRSYLTYLVGDSMIEALGKNANRLRMDLIAYYPENEFVNYNYGFGSTNILSLPERLNNKTRYNGEAYPAILSQGFDLIIIDSFAYNPLSEMTLSEGLKKQEEILDLSVTDIIKARPNSVVAILGPIAPSKEMFAKGVYKLTKEERNEWALERIAYIENAISYAKKRNIPLINVYQRSLNSQGNTDIKYIDPTDYIHPSTDGVELMSKTIAEFIYENNIFPK